MPANAPEATTATHLWRITLTPRLSAACGFSPHDRSRRPKAVFHNTHADTPTSTKTSTVITFRLVVSADTTDAMSDTMNQCCSANVVAPSESPGIVMLGGRSSPV